MYSFSPVLAAFACFLHSRVSCLFLHYSSPTARSFISHRIFLLAAFLSPARRHPSRTPRLPRSFATARSASPSPHRRPSPRGVIALRTFPPSFRPCGLPFPPSSPRHAIALSFVIAWTPFFSTVGRIPPWARRRHRSPCFVRYTLSSASILDLVAALAAFYSLYDYRCVILHESTATKHKGRLVSFANVSTHGRTDLYGEGRSAGGLGTPRPCRNDRLS